MRVAISSHPNVVVCNTCSVSDDSIEIEKYYSQSVAIVLVKFVGKRRNL